MKLPWARKNTYRIGYPRIASVNRDYSAYQQYMRSPAWQEKRKAVIERDDGRCQDCGGIGTQVHHKHYDRLYQEDLDDLVLLCSDCHKARHGRQPIPKPPVRRKSKSWKTGRRKQRRSSFGRKSRTKSKRRKHIRS